MILPMTTAPHANSPEEVWTIGKLIATSADYLKGKDLDEPRLSAEILLAHALQCSRLHIYTRWTEVVSQESRTAFRECIRRAAAGEPPAYIVGHKEFFSMDFEVSAAVLIPRPETELLVERVIAFVREHPRQAWSLFEPGTGSGNIGAAILKSVPTATLVAGDISPEAIVVAGRNYQKHGLSDRAKVVQADWMDLPAGLLPEGGFDLIVTNPPYIATTQRETVHPGVLASEPSVALFGGTDGLEFYRRAAAQGPGLLKNDGIFFCEVGCDQANEVADLFQQAGWQNVARWKDLAGIERTMQFAPPAKI